jgi:hypothetical protein
MTDQDPRFFKGLRKNRPRVAEARDDVEGSVYHLWWRFLRLSPVFWFAWRYEICPYGAKLPYVFEEFQPLNGTHFYYWWKSVGRNLFAEAERPANVKRVSRGYLEMTEADSRKIYVEVPLTIRRQTILRQFSALLAEVHDGRRLDLAAHSTARYRLHTKRYRLSALENAYWVYVYRLLFPDIEVWRIGDRLQLAPHHKMRDSNGYISRSPNPGLKSLQALTGRYLYKARFMLLHAERGSFPNSETIAVDDERDPFTPADQARYRVEVAQDGEWNKWLKNRLLWELTEMIIDRNHLVGEQVAKASRNVRLNEFVAGRSDLI